MTATTSSKNTYAVLITALVVCVLTSAFMMPFIPDDSYISFRYAENLAQGYGLTFNQGEAPVEGYSNFLWILFCAALHQGGMDLPSFMPYVGILLGLLNVFVLWILLKRRKLPALQMLFPLVLFASCGPLITYVISGLETPLYSLLLLLMINWLDHVFDSGKLLYYVLLAVSGVLLSLTRPEGIFVFPAVVVFAWWIQRRKGNEGIADKHQTKHLMVATTVFLLLTIAYQAWRINYFGEVIPTPFMSKGGAGKSLFEAWRANFFIYFTKQGDYYPPIGYYFAGLMIAAALGLSWSISKPKYKRSETIALWLVIVHFLVYFNFKDWMPGMRYHSATAGLLFLPAAQVLTPFFRSHSGALQKRQIRQLALVGLAIVGLSFSVVAQLHMVTAQMEQGNQKCLVALGKWLREIMPPGSVLAISDVGAIPYYSGFKTIDIHPESLTDMYIAKNGYSIEYFYQRRADIVIFPSRGQLVTKFYPQHYATAEDPRFNRFYRHLASARFDWHQDRSYWIFIPGPYPKISKELMDRFPHGIGTIAHKKE